MVYTMPTLIITTEDYAMLKPYEIIDVSVIPAGTLFLSVDANNEVFAHFGETWTIGNDVYSTSSSTYLGDSFTPVTKTTVIAMPLTISDITTVAVPLWANYVTVSGSGYVTYWEYEPSAESNGDDFDDYPYDFDVCNKSAGKTSLPYYYKHCYKLNELL